MTCMPNSFLVTEARVPSEFSIAVSSTSAACAAYAVYGLEPRQAFSALNAVDELRAGTLQLLGGDAGDRHVHALGRFAGRARAVDAWLSS